MNPLKMEFSSSMGGWGVISRNVVPITLEESMSKVRRILEDSVEEGSQIPFVQVRPSNDRQIEEVTVHNLLDGVLVDQGTSRTFASHRPRR